MKKIVLKTSAWIAALIPASVMAAIEPLPTATAPKNLTGFLDVINKIAKWMYNLLLALGVVFVLYAAFLYLLSQGSDDKITTAKRVLIYAIVALVIAVLAGGVSSIVKDALRTGGT